MAEEQPGPPASQGPDWDEARKKLMGATGADRLILIAGLAMLIVSFMPWYGISVGGLFSANISGWRSGFFAWAGILLGILAGVFAAIRVLGVKLDLGTPDGTIYLALGGGSFVLVLLRLLTETSFTKFGLYLGLVAAGVAAFGGYQKFQQSKAV